MSHSIKDGDGRFKVTCPHCGKPILVTLPVHNGETKPEPEALEVLYEKEYIPPPIEEPDEVEEPDSVEEQEFREKIVNVILSKKFELPLLPHVAMKVIKLTGDATSSMQDLAKVIMTDQMMTTKIIKISNSPVYSGTIKVTNIKQALVRLGQAEIRNFMLAVSMGSKVFKSEMFSSLARRLWENSVGTAFANRVIAHALRMDREQAFLTGLLCDLGKMIMLNILETTLRDSRSDFRPSKRTILELWSQYQTDVGELAAEKWELPEFVTKAVLNHHKLEEMGEEPNKMVASVALASLFCKVKGIGVDPVEINVDQSYPAMKLNLTSDACFELLDRFGRTYDSLKHEFL